MSQDYFAKVASQWDSLRADMFTEAVQEAAIAHAALHPNAVVADIGAGTGFLTQGLAPLVAQVHLVDKSEQMLAIARKNLAAFSNVEYHLADGAEIPLPDESMDAVLANMYLHHMTDPQAAIREMVRVLRPGGRLVITDLDEHTHTWLREEQQDEWLGFSREQVQTWFSTAGLVNVQVKDTQTTCCSESQAGKGEAAVSIFVATGAKAIPQMQAAVKELYRQIAQSGSSCCGPSQAADVISPDSILEGSGRLEAASCCGPSAMPATKASISLGCGNPVGLASLQPGEVVLDIGSGAGADVFPAADRVGPQGKVIGMDMLEEMLARARETAQVHGYSNVEFRQGDAQAMPVEDGSVDVVMSNCVINLVQDKALAFREAYRVLKPGGRLSISDIVTDRPFSPAIREDPNSWAACVTGALTEAEYLALVTQAGFTSLATERSVAMPAEDGTQVYSLNVKAMKPVPA